MNPAKFQWDHSKATSNLLKHGISFEVAKTVFNDPFAITIRDPRPYAEERWLEIGTASTGQLLVVWYTESVDGIRLIGARPATRTERRAYEDE